MTHALTSKFGDADTSDVEALLQRPEVLDFISRVNKVLYILDS